MWAVQGDLEDAVHTFLENGAPCAVRVLPPWTAAYMHPDSPPTSADVEAARRAGAMPLAYYVVVRGWHISAIQPMLETGWNELQSAIATASPNRLSMLKSLIARSFVFRPPTHFSHMSHPTFSHISQFQSCFCRQLTARGSQRALEAIRRLAAALGGLLG